MEWSPEFCLVCDRQTDGGIYCGEACRLAEYEKANSTSEAGSPTSPRGFPAAAWPSTRMANIAYEILPAHDNVAQMSSQSLFTPRSSAFVASPEHTLTPSSSHSSIVSMQSSSSTVSTPTESSHPLSNEACRELRAYAGSFDLSRYQRRQSA